MHNYLRHSLRPEVSADLCFHVLQSKRCTFVDERFKRNGEDLRDTARCIASGIMVCLHENNAPPGGGAARVGGVNGDDTQQEQG